MQSNTNYVNTPIFSLGGALLALARLLKEFLLLIIVTDYLARGIGRESPIGQSYIHVVETWHIWIAIVAYIAIAAILSQVIWKNLKYVCALVRRISRAYRRITR